MGLLTILVRLCHHPLPVLQWYSGYGEFGGLLCLQHRWMCGTRRWRCFDAWTIWWHLMKLLYCNKNCTNQTMVIVGDPIHHSSGSISNLDLPFDTFQNKNWSLILFLFYSQRVNDTLATKWGNYIGIEVPLFQDTVRTWWSNTISHPSPIRWGLILLYQSIDLSLG